MQKRFLITVLIALLTVVGAIVPTGTAQAMTAEQYFADGNRLFRDDLYFAALLRYRQAGEEGMDAALLHYNMGIAHYRARGSTFARAMRFSRPWRSPRCALPLITTWA